MMLAGDVGGTKTLIGLFDHDGERLVLIEEWCVSSCDYSGLEAVLEAFIRPRTVVLSAACFGIAGPVINGRCQAINLPWIIDAKQIAQILELDTVSLLNDLEAMAHGIDGLRDDELYALNRGEPVPRGNRALIAAGTGLGEALLFHDEDRYHPSATEGGHCDFAPQTDEEIKLLRYLRDQFGHVSYERVLSGAGLHHLYLFYLAERQIDEPKWLTEEMSTMEPAGVIAKCALAKGFEPSEASLRLYVRLYGAEAGNLALKALATGGLYIGGGIAPKILPALANGAFMEAFVDKGRHRNLLEQIPVSVILNERTALLGAARYASQLYSQISGTCRPEPTVKR